MTRQLVIERVMQTSGPAKPLEAGDYILSRSGRSAYAINRVRRIVNTDQVRLFLVRVKRGDVPVGTQPAPYPWPHTPRKALLEPSARPPIGPPAQPPVKPAMTSPASRRSQERERIISLLHDDRDTDRPVPAVRVQNQTATVGEWRDPADVSPNRRVAKTVRGYRTYDALHTMEDNGTVGRSHLRALRRFRKEYELGEIGLHPTKNLLEEPSGFSTGTPPSEARMQALECYRATVGALSRRLLEVILAVVIHNQTLLSYALARRMNRQAVSGYFLAATDRLLDHYKKLDDDRRKESEAPARG